MICQTITHKKTIHNLIKSTEDSNNIYGGNMKNLAVFFGGKSTEHDVSIITALQMIKILNSIDEYVVYPIYFNSANEMMCAKNPNSLSIENFGKKFNNRCFYKVLLTSGDSALYKRHFGKYKKMCTIDVAINCCHGGVGENGSLSGMADICNFPVVCGDNASMALCMDKRLTKIMCQNNNLGVVPYKCVELAHFLESAEAILSEFNSFPYIVKPANLGSSIGVSCVNNIVELKDALNLVYQFDDLALVEEKVQNLHEYNCSVIGSARLNEILVSDIEEPKIKDTFLTFEDKYVSGEKNKGAKKCDFQKGGMQNLSRKFPADIADDLKYKIQRYSKQVFKLFNLSGVCRIDYLYDAKTGELYINEINAVPGSLAYYFWTRHFGDESKFLRYLISMSEKEFLYKNGKNFTFFSSILDNL